MEMRMDVIAALIVNLRYGSLLLRTRWEQPSAVEEKEMDDWQAASHPWHWEVWKGYGTGAAYGRKNTINNSCPDYNCMRNR